MPNTRRAGIVCLEHFPYSLTPADLQITELNAQGAPAETLSLSFSVCAQAPTGEVTLSVTDLTGPGGRISADCIDLHVVKVWEQSGIGIYRSTGILTPELLVKDDRVPYHDGYRRIFPTWKQYIRPRRVFRAPDIWLVGDVRTAFGAGVPKQIWARVRIPASTAAGAYHGRITFSGHGDLPVHVEVLPIVLAEPEQDLFMWFKGTLDWTRPQHYVSEPVFRAQLQDIFDLGFRSISLSEHRAPLLQRALDIARDVGFRRNVLLVYPYPPDFLDLDFHGMRPLVYVSDEIDARGKDAVAAHIRELRGKPAGAKSMISLRQQSFFRRLQDNSDIGHAPDIVSYFLPDNLAYFMALSQFPHLSADNVYYYWPLHMEKPDLHRVLSGLLLWKSRAAGISPYCYQHLPVPPSSPYDDFDDWDAGTPADTRPLRDHMATYPARSGSIPTVQWEGLREGINDLRYLTTLQKALGRAALHQEASALIDEAVARREAFLARIKFPTVSILSDTERQPYPDISPEQYHAFRAQMAKDIMALREYCDAEPRMTK